MTDRVFQDPAMIHLAILTVCIAMLLLSLTSLLIGFRPYVALVNRLQRGAIAPIAG
jgi:hypothetical protein